MNLHIDKNEFDLLINSKLVGQFVIGSKLYGLDDADSDTDYLVIYHPFKNQLQSPFNNHHQFQYKDTENNADYNFVDSITFIKNLIKGDSTINYELLHSEQFKSCSLSFLMSFIPAFRTYTICKAYLGFANRDLKMLNQRKTHKDKLAGILHAKRSYWFARNIFDEKFELELTDLKEYKQYLKTLDYIDPRALSEQREIIDSYRKTIINPALENKLIFRYLDPRVQHLIDLRFQNRIEINEAKLDLSRIYEANEEIELKY